MILKSKVLLGANQETTSRVGTEQGGGICLLEWVRCQIVQSKGSRRVRTLTCWRKNENVCTEYWVALGEGGVKAVEGVYKTGV